MEETTSDATHSDPTRKGEVERTSDSTEKGGVETTSNPTQAVVVVESLQGNVEGHPTQLKEDPTQEKGDEGMVVTGKYFLRSISMVNLIGFFYLYFTFGKV